MLRPAQRDHLHKILWVLGNAVAQDPHAINFYVDAAVKEVGNMLDGKTQAEQEVRPLSPSIRFAGRVAQDEQTFVVALVTYWVFP